MDHVVSVAVLEYLANDDESFKALSEMVRILKPGGTITTVLNNDKDFFSTIPPQYRDKLFQSRAWYLRSACELGLTNVSFYVEKDVFKPTKWWDAVGRYTVVMSKPDALAALASCATSHPSQGSSKTPTKAQNRVVEPLVPVVDVVVPSSMGIKSKGGDGSYDSLRRDRDNGEMLYVLRSLVENAPWVRRVHILVNGKVEVPKSWDGEVFLDRIYFVDRCSYMPKDTCPTRNSHAVLTNVYLYTELAEHFILVEDDIFLGIPTDQSFFFAPDGRPRVFHRSGAHSLYKSIPTEMKGKAIPKTNGGVPHYWYPMLKSVVREIAVQFPEYTAFVSSHREGRFSSASNGVNDHTNSQEEEPLGVWQAHLLATGKGVPTSIMYPGQSIGDWEADLRIPSSLKALFNRKPMPVFCNINDVYSTEPALYQEQRRRVLTYLDAAFKGPLRFESGSECWSYLQRSYAHESSRQPAMLPLRHCSWNKQGRGVIRDNSPKLSSQCKTHLRSLDKTLLGLGLIYFIRSGTELCVYRDGNLCGGGEKDIDVFVKSSSSSLYKQLSAKLPETRRVGN
jgi:hypothetical protein